MIRFLFRVLLVSLCLPPLASATDAPADRFLLSEVFDLEVANDPRISPDGSRIVYVRTSMDILSDRQVSRLWIVDVASGEHRPLSEPEENASSPRWSPQGDRLLYVGKADRTAQLYVRWTGSGETALLTQILRPPKGVAWSPDGSQIAFSMLVPEPEEPFVDLPPAPAGADWAPRPRVIEELQYRSDGDGYLEEGYAQLFVLPADGGTPRQVTSGPFHHDGTPVWNPDGKRLIFSANRHEDWRYEPLDSEVYELDLEDGAIRALTDRRGPDRSPALSPDGRKLAYLGFDDRLQGYQVTTLYVADRDGGAPRPLTTALDRDVEEPVWSADGSRLYFQYDDRGETRLASVTLKGEIATLVDDVGGTSLGRPYSGGSFTVSRTGVIAYTLSRPDRPADVGLLDGGQSRRLTGLNDDLFGHKRLAEIEEIWWESSHDGRRIQGWIARPPGFDSNLTYPMILEIHGGPFANYGPRFSAEIQLYAAAGYVVLYANPRGSSSYGEEFGNLIHHAYPDKDYDDLMSGVDALLERGYVDPQRLFVTGGSGGGVLSSWIVGKTDRFRAAVVAKPVINWTSFVLTADRTGFFYKYWFPGLPWDHRDEYWRRSPLSLVGNVTTPTMLLTGEADYRTPISESEQYYQALKLRRIPSALVRIPGASHGIANRPSQLMAKVAYILEWFSRHGGSGE